MDVWFFFFQAEDGIRDYKVTGVQTCALPICGVCLCSQLLGRLRWEDGLSPGGGGYGEPRLCHKIGRAAWRGRGEISVVAVSFKKKKTNRQSRSVRYEDTRPTVATARKQPAHY